MSAPRLTDAQLDTALRSDHARERAPRASPCRDRRAGPPRPTRQRQLPCRRSSPRSWTSTRRCAGGPCSWRRPLLLPSLAGVSAAVVGSLLNERRQDFVPEPVALAPPTDLPTFVRSAYDSDAGAGADDHHLGRAEDGDDQAPDLRRRLRGHPHRDFASPDATEPNGYEDLHATNTRAQLVTVGSERRWDPGCWPERSCEDPRVFVYAIDAQAPGPPGKHRHPGARWGLMQPWRGVRRRAGAGVAVRRRGDSRGTRRPTTSRAAAATGGSIIETRLDAQALDLLQEFSEVTELDVRAAACRSVRHAAARGRRDDLQRGVLPAPRTLHARQRPGPCRRFVPAREGAEPPADLDALITGALAADDALPAYEVVVTGSDTKNPGSSQRQVHHDGSGALPLRGRPTNLRPTHRRSG